MRWRSLVAFALLLGYGVTSLEVAVGEVRDGEIHHESNLQAIDHTQSSQGEHGHEDGGRTPEHGPDHQHGTSGDHCTHTHSVSLVSASYSFLIIAFLGSATEPANGLPSEPVVDTLFQPPKA